MIPEDLWVQQLFPVMLGRRTHGAFEVQLWARLASLRGREVVLRALCCSTEPLSDVRAGPLHRLDGPVLLRSLFENLELGPPPQDAVTDDLLAWDRQVYAALQRTSGSFLDRLLEEACAKDTTVEEVARSLQDRLLSSSRWQREERRLIEALLGPLERRMSEVGHGDLRERLGLLCGVWSMTADFMLSEPRPSGPLPPLLLDRDVDCALLASLTTRAGVPVTCTELGF
jgi:hypothetical protein